MKHLQITALFLSLAATAFTTSCAATKGLGQDLQKVGNRIETRADETGGAQPDGPVVPPVPTREPAAY
jgi:predicted small secreted protein